jgi:serine/tyrosine/threonine adenylyltransferase
MTFQLRKALILNFDNQWLRDLPGDTIAENRIRQVQGAMWSRVAPTPVSAPKLIAFAPNVLKLLGLTETEIRTPKWVEALSGNGLIPGMEPNATCYGGHQFGNWAGQLGDGRAISLGESINEKGERWELQLKGAGPTPYSRHADGRAVLRSSIREFLCSEAMHGLGIPTTRALSLVTTGDGVTRDMFYDGNPEVEPGAIVCRVAPSFVRFGHFELPAARGDIVLLEKLVAFVIKRDFPHIEGSVIEARAAWFKEVCERTAFMVAEWMRVGFVHGVMNTDNMSILGLTIDYGPYGWIDNFDPGWTPNTTDAQGKRYAFGRQPAIAKWNLSCLAGALSKLTEDDAWLHAGLDAFDKKYGETMQTNLAGKFGFRQWREGDEGLVNTAFDVMTAAEIDMTIFFRLLSKNGLFAPQVLAFKDCFYTDELFIQHRNALAAWLDIYSKRVQHEAIPAALNAAKMDAVNPSFVLRNYLAQEAIDAATAGDFTPLERLLKASESPYSSPENESDFYAKRPDWARTKAGCSMLSCSS